MRESDKSPGLWLTSHTEISNLLVCEERWRRRYLDKQPEGRVTEPMLQGILVGAAVGAWYRGEGREGAIAALSQTWTEREEFAEFSTTSDLAADTGWLVDRWFAAYGERPPAGWECVGTEYHVEAEIGYLPGGRRVGFQGYLDAAVLIDGDLWLVEVKCSGDKNRADTAMVEPQISDYCLAWEIETGQRPFGVIFDHVYTYRWKRDQHPPEDSFNRVFADRTEQQLRVADMEIMSNADRMHDIATGQVLARHNVSTRSCNTCGFKAECWADLAFEPEQTIEMEED